MGCDYYATEDGEMTVEVTLCRKDIHGNHEEEVKKFKLKIKKGDAIYFDHDGPTRER